MRENESAGAAVRNVIDTPALRQLVPLSAGESFRWMEHHYPAAIARWNYHPEVEIHLIRRSNGSYLIGDQVGAFGPGHVAIVGADVPHDWMSDLEPGEVIENRDSVIQFLPSWLDGAAKAIPELDTARLLVQRSRRGIIFTGETAVRAGQEIEQVGETSGALRIAHFFSLLHTLSNAPEPDCHYVSHALYTASADRNGRAAVDAGLAYVVENLTGNISMAKAARLAHMSEPSFSKYFKKASGMTFSEMVRRLRIANACRLLDQTEFTVAEISTAVGYQNLANFNRQFRTETGFTPTQYRRMDVSSRPHIGVASQATASSAQ